MNKYYCTVVCGRYLWKQNVVTIGRKQFSFSRRIDPVFETQLSIKFQAKFSNPDHHKVVHNQGFRMTHVMPRTRTYIKKYAWPVTMHPPYCRTCFRVWPKVLIKLFGKRQMFCSRYFMYASNPGYPITPELKWIQISARFANLPDPSNCYHGRRRPLGSVWFRQRRWFHGECPFEGDHTIIPCKLYRHKDVLFPEPQTCRSIPLIVLCKWIWGVRHAVHVLSSHKSSCATQCHACANSIRSNSCTAYFSQGPWPPYNGVVHSRRLVKFMMKFICGDHWSTDRQNYSETTTSMVLAFDPIYGRNTRGDNVNVSPNIIFGDSEPCTTKVKPGTNFHPGITKWYTVNYRIWICGAVNEVTA